MYQVLGIKLKLIPHFDLSPKRQFYKIFKCQGKADGIFRSHYSPSLSLFLYPNLSPIGLLPICAPAWPYFRVS